MALLLGVSCSGRGFVYGLMAALLLQSGARAEPVSPSQTGSQSFTNLGSATAGPTTDINDSTNFTIGKLITTKSSSGFFTGLSRQTFSPISFSISNPNSLQFGTTEFGTFASTKIRQLSNDPLVGSRSFWIEGTFTQGTFGTPLYPNPMLANLTLSFNQTAGAGTSISVNATLDFAAIQPVPEPSTVALATVALGTAGLVWLRRGRSRKPNSAATSGPRRQG